MSRTVRAGRLLFRTARLLAPLWLASVAASVPVPGVAAREPPLGPAGAGTSTAGAVAGRVPASGTADTVPRGELLERLTSDADPDRSYALLLPPGYAADRPRPLLLVLDPRGRALRALSIFRRGAERRGWIVMSSYDTRSDTTGEGNEAALRAMIADADRLEVDGRRLYLAGFSGTARFGWQVALSLPDRVAGLIGVSAGWTPALEALVRSGARELRATFSFWGGAGRLGFNHEEVRRLDSTLDELGVRHRIEPYAGRHGWLPASQATAAVDWLELQAMRTGLRAPDEALIDSLHDGAVRAARAADSAGRAAEALDRWRRVIAHFGDFRSVTEARERAGELAGDPAVRRRREQQERLADEHRAFRERMEEVLPRIGSEEDRLDPTAAAEELGLAALRRRAAAGSTPDARAAGRLLEQLYVQASFYLPRRAIRRGDPVEALAYLELAERARPDRIRTLWFRARALAASGRPDEALAALGDLVRRGFPRSRLAEDPRLAPLRGDPRWSEIIGEPEDAEGASSEGADRPSRSPS